jgi:biopolymer transport protein ExbD
MAMQSGGDDELVQGINVTPLVDITLVLLIVFMVTASFVSEQGLSVTLPKVAAQENAPTPAITVSLDAQGGLKIMKKETDLDGLRRQMEVEARSNPAVKVLVKADKAVSYESLSQVLDAIKLGGVNKVALAMERK